MPGTAAALDLRRLMDVEGVSENLSRGLPDVKGAALFPPPGGNWLRGRFASNDTETAWRAAPDCSNTHSRQCVLKGGTIGGRGLPPTFKRELLAPRASRTGFPSGLLDFKGLAELPGATGCDPVATAWCGLHC